MLNFLVVATLFCVATTWGRHFENPVLGGADYPDPGAIKHDGAYYVVTTTNNNHPEKFPIHKSLDLQTWELVGYIFNGTNIPPFTGQEREFWAPELHKIGENDFRIYFTTYDFSSTRLVIAVASAKNITGPWVPAEKPLVVDPNRGFWDSTLLNDNGNLYFFWSAGVWIYGRKMNPDGLSFSSDEVVEIIANDTAWEGGGVEAPWFTIRNNTYYLIYSGNFFCGNDYAVGVAKSKNPFGPYEKLGHPILVKDDVFKGPGHCSVVKDIDDVNDVMIYHAYKVGEVCDPYPRLMMAQSMAWGSDGWPYMTP